MMFFAQACGRENCGSLVALALEDRDVEVEDDVVHLHRDRSCRPSSSCRRCCCSGRRTRTRASSSSRGVGVAVRRRRGSRRCSPRSPGPGGACPSPCGFPTPLPNTIPYVEVPWLSTAVVAVCQMRPAKSTWVSRQPMSRDLAADALALESARARPSRRSSRRIDARAMSMSGSSGDHRSTQRTSSCAIAARSAAGGSVIVSR